MQSGQPSISECSVQSYFSDKNWAEKLLHPRHCLYWASGSAGFPGCALISSFPRNSSTIVNGMFAVFIRSLGYHSHWFLYSFCTEKHTGVPLSLHRLLLLVIGMPLFIFLQLIHWVGFLIDEICFSAYRKVEVKAPLFISGIPRSGTTFVHRTLATNRSAFCTVSTWEAILAPSITERKCIARLRSLDRRIGSPLKKTINSLLS